MGGSAGVGTSHTHTQRASGGPFHPVHFAHFNLLLHTIIISELFPGTLACRGHSCNTEKRATEKRPCPTFETVQDGGGGGGSPADLTKRRFGPTRVPGLAFLV